MTRQKLSKFDEKYLKKHYITKFKIDDTNKSIAVFYINGSKDIYPLNSAVLNSLSKIMKMQYNEWSNFIKKIYAYNLIKLLYINIHLKKQKYYLEHENDFNNCNVKKDLFDKKMTKKELASINKAKKNTHCYFGLSNVDNYTLSTMKKAHRIISIDSKNISRKVK